MITTKKYAMYYISSSEYARVYMFAVSHTISDAI